VPTDVFDGIKAGLLKDRAQFIADFNLPFFGINKGQKVSDGVLTQTLQIALLASLKSTVDCVTAALPICSLSWAISSSCASKMSSA